MTSVLLAGGGTAGHISPLLATAQALRRCRPGLTMNCVGTVKGLETSLVPAAGLDLRLILAVPLPRRLTLDLGKLPWRVRQAVREAAAIIDDVRPDVVVGFGGYVSLPVYIAARHRVPVVMHEQNALPGLANRLEARRAAVVLVTVPGTPLPRARCVGLPVRESLSELADAGRASVRDAARREFGLPAGGPVLLVSGGSQGARTLNEATAGARRRLLDAGVSVLHVWGRRDFPGDAAKLTADSGAVYAPVSYVDDMARAYAAADLMLARAGAATVAETATVGLPCLFVPFPHGNGEQRRNAAPVVSAGGGCEIADADLTADTLVAAALPLLRDPERLAQLGQTAQSVIQPGAARRVADIVLAVADANRSKAVDA